MPKRYTDTDKWKKSFIKGLPAKYKLLWLYILDDCCHAGIWETDFEVASIRIGSKVTEKEAIKYYQKQIKIFDDGNKWFIPKFIDFQYGQLNANSKPHQSVIKRIDKYDVYNIEGISPIDVAGFEGEIAKPIINKFKKPTVEQIEDYCNERSNTVNANKFYDFYESKGWVVGKSKMKDWKAAVRNWESSSSNNKAYPISKVESQLTSWKKARDIIKNQ